MGSIYRNTTIKGQEQHENTKLDESTPMNKILT